MSKTKLIPVAALLMIAASGCGLSQPLTPTTARAAVAGQAQGLLLVEAPAALRGNGAIAMRFAFPNAAGYQVQALGDPMDKVVVALVAGGQTVASASATRADAQNGVATVKFADLKAGAYTVQVTALDAAGKTLGQASGDAKVQSGQTASFHLNLQLGAPTGAGTGGLNVSIGIQDGSAPSPAPSVAPSVAPSPVPSADPSTAPAGDWKLDFRQDFKDLSDVVRFQSSVATNDKALPTDQKNKALQTPTLRDNVAVVADPLAEDGHALAVYTREGQYQTSKGLVNGWTNGRMMIANHDETPPVRIRTRLRLTASAYTKSAIMWWPAKGGWPWEVDFVETQGGASLTTGAGSRQSVQENWHSDLNHDGKATEQLQGQIALDATKYHVYDLFIQPKHMWIEVDGLKRFETTDPKWIPTGPGEFSIGKAMTTRRDIQGRTPDTVFVDYLELYTQ